MSPTPIPDAAVASTVEATSTPTSSRQLNGMTLSVIVPCFNEEEMIELAYSALADTLSGKDFELELMFVNDGSADTTLSKLRAIAARDARVNVISFSRNFGHQLAVTAGLDHCTGDIAVVIDADLQDPPAVILQMLEKWLEGFDVVYGQRSERAGETQFKLVTSRYFYRVLNYFSDTAIPMDTGDFRLMDRRVVDALKQMPERDRFLRGMVSWAGFRQTPLHYEREARAAGETKYPLKKMITFATTGILSFSSKPLRVATFTGIGISALAGLGIFYAVLMRIFSEHWVSGWTFIVVALLFMGGIQLIFLGVIGEYIARIYEENKNRPLYLIDEKIGLQEPPR